MFVAKCLTRFAVLCLLVATPAIQPASAADKLGARAVSGFAKNCLVGRTTVDRLAAGFRRSGWRRGSSADKKAVKRVLSLARSAMKSKGRMEVFGRVQWAQPAGRGGQQDQSDISGCRMLRLRAGCALCIRRSGACRTDQSQADPQTDIERRRAANRMARPCGPFRTCRRKICLRRPGRACRPRYRHERRCAGNDHYPEEIADPIPIDAQIVPIQ